CPASISPPPAATAPFSSWTMAFPGSVPAFSTMSRNSTANSIRTRRDGFHLAGREMGDLMPRHLNIGLSLSTTWLTGNGWRREDSRVEDIHSVEFYAAIAKRAEAAKLDFVFRPDALFLKPEMV